MNIEQTIEQVEKLYQRIAGQEIPPTSNGSFAPVNPDVNLGMLLDLRMTQLLQVLQDPNIQMRLQPWTPPTSIWEAEDRVTICMEVCGTNKSDIDIAIRENVLIVTGTRRSVAPTTSGHQPRRLEIPTGPFQRLVVLPPNLVSPEITSNLRDGVLEITLTKSEQKTSSPNGSVKKSKGSSLQ